MSEGEAEPLAKQQNVDGEADNTAPTNKEAKKRKRATKDLTISQQTLRNPPWSYMHLKRITSRPEDTPLDEATVSIWLDAALDRFLGLHGRAIPIDIMKLENHDIWIRLPNEDQPALTAALAGWSSRGEIALRVVGWSSWDAHGYGQNNGQDLFGA